MNRQNHVVIISAELTNQSHFDNQARTERLRGLLSKLHFSHGDFSGYSSIRRFQNGKLEDAFVVALKDGAQEVELLKLKQIADDFNQEAIVHSDSNRHTQLLFADGVESLGQLVSATREEAEDFGNYFTRDTKSKGSVANVYHYIIKKVQ